MFQIIPPHSSNDFSNCYRRESCNKNGAWKTQRI